MKVRFKCPKCGGKVLEEVMVGVVQSSVVTDVDAKTGAVEYGDKSSEGGEVVAYQCMACGEQLVAASGYDGGATITEAEEMIQWLDDHKPAKKAAKGKKS